MPQTPHGVNFEAHRPVVMGRNGMVCAGQPLAVQAGISILQKGGNAVDAAIATAGRAERAGALGGSGGSGKDVHQADSDSGTLQGAADPLYDEYAVGW